MSTKKPVKLSEYYSYLDSQGLQRLERDSAIYRENRYNHLRNKFKDFVFYSAVGDFDVNIKHSSKDASAIARELIREGHDVYFVGGVIRDLLLGKGFKDVDLTTTAEPTQVKKIFGRRCRIIGRRFVLSHVYSGSLIFDVATLRNTKTINDTGTGLIELEDHYSKSVADDAFRRDFTVNALYYNFKADHILDFFNGVQDLHQHLLRSIGDPFIRLREDPIRIIRAIRQAARTDFWIEQKLSQAMFTHRKLIRNASSARLCDEIIKTISGQAASMSFVNMLRYDLLNICFPELVPVFEGEITSSIQNSHLNGLKPELQQKITSLWSQISPELENNFVDSALLQAHSETLLQILAGTAITELRIAHDQPVNYAFMLANMRAPAFVNQVLQFKATITKRRRLLSEMRKAAITSFNHPSINRLPSLYKKDQESATEILRYLGMMILDPASDADRTKMELPMCRAAYSILKLMTQLFNFNPTVMANFASWNGLFNLYQKNLQQRGRNVKSGRKQVRASKLELTEASILQEVIPMLIEGEAALIIHAANKFVGRGDVSKGSQSPYKYSKSLSKNRYLVESLKHGYLPYAQFIFSELETLGFINHESILSWALNQHFTNQKQAISSFSKARKTARKALAQKNFNQGTVDGFDEGSYQVIVGNWADFNRERQQQLGLQLEQHKSLLEDSAPNNPANVSTVETKNGTKAEAKAETKAVAKIEAKIAAINADFPPHSASVFKENAEYHPYAVLSYGPEEERLRQALEELASEHLVGNYDAESFSFNRQGKFAKHQPFNAGLGMSIQDIASGIDLLIPTESGLAYERKLNDIQFLTSEAKSYLANPSQLASKLKERFNSRIKINGGTFSHNYHPMLTEIYTQYLFAHPEQVGEILSILSTLNSGFSHDLPVHDSQVSLTQAEANRTQGNQSPVLEFADVYSMADYYDETRFTEHRSRHIPSLTSKQNLGLLFGMFEGLRHQHKQQMLLGLRDLFDIFVRDQEVTPGSDLEIEQEIFQEYHQGRVKVSSKATVSSRLDFAEQEQRAQLAKEKGQAVSATYGELDEIRTEGSYLDSPTRDLTSLYHEDWESKGMYHPDTLQELIDWQQLIANIKDKYQDYLDADGVTDLSSNLTELFASREIFNQFDANAGDLSLTSAEAPTQAKASKANGKENSKEGSKANSKASNKANDRTPGSNTLSSQTNSDYPLPNWGSEVESEVRPATRVTSKTTNTKTTSKTITKTSPESHQLGGEQVLAQSLNLGSETGDFFLTLERAVTAAATQHSLQTQQSQGKSATSGAQGKNSKATNGKNPESPAKKHPLGLAPGQNAELTSGENQLQQLANQQLANQQQENQQQKNLHLNHQHLNAQLPNNQSVGSQALRKDKLRNTSGDLFEDKFAGEVESLSAEALDSAGGYLQYSEVDFGGEHHDLAPNLVRDASGSLLYQSPEISNPIEVNLTELTQLLLEAVKSSQQKTQSRSESLDDADYSSQAIPTSQKQRAILGTISYQVSERVLASLMGTNKSSTKASITKKSPTKEIEEDVITEVAKEFVNKSAKELAKESTNEVSKETRKKVAGTEANKEVDNERVKRPISAKLANAYEDEYSDEYLDEYSEEYSDQFASDSSADLNESDFFFDADTFQRKHQEYLAELYKKLPELVDLFDFKRYKK